MRLLAWNIRHGGGKRLALILDAIRGHDRDVVVLCEYRGSTGPRLREGLRRMGYRYATGVEPPRGCNGVLIAARKPIGAGRVLTGRVECPYRLVHAELSGGIQLVGMYMPNLLRKVPYWEAVIRAARRRRSADAVFVGDFNTTRHYLDEAGTLCLTSAYMDRIEEAGFRDVWRMRYPKGREYSWYSHRGNGFRLDHVFCSESLVRRLATVRYSHAERLEGLSDHSVILMELHAAPEGGAAVRRRTAAEA